MFKQDYKDLCTVYAAEQKRAFGIDVTAWYEGGWFKTNKGNRYRRLDFVERIEKTKEKPDHVHENVAPRLPGF